MNLELFAEITAKNGADIAAIVAKIGIPTMIELAPHVVAILKTIQDQAQPQPSK